MSEKNNQMLDSLRSELNLRVDHGWEPGKIAESVFGIGAEVFSDYHNSTEFFGAYEPDPDTLITPGLSVDVIRAIWEEGQYMIKHPASVGEGCPTVPYDFRKSVMARSIITGLDQHIPDVHQDPSHWACSPKAKHEEVYLILSEPFSKGLLKGRRVPMAVFDIDFLRENAITRTESKKLGRILRPYGKLIYPGEGVEPGLSSSIYRTYVGS